jgi:hypothetical protein
MRFSFFLSYRKLVVVFLSIEFGRHSIWRRNRLGGKVFVNWNTRMCAADTQNSAFDSYWIKAMILQKTAFGCSPEYSRKALHL